MARDIPYAMVTLLTYELLRQAAVRAKMKTQHQGEGEAGEYLFKHRVRRGFCLEAQQEQQRIGKCWHLNTRTCNSRGIYCSSRPYFFLFLLCPLNMCRTSFSPLTRQRITQ
jgi:hypothetical protein